jgi:hypothetical protein
LNRVIIFTRNDLKCQQLGGNLHVTPTFILHVSFQNFLHVDFRNTILMDTFSNILRISSEFKQYYNNWTLSIQDFNIILDQTWKLALLEYFRRTAMPYFLKFSIICVDRLARLFKYLVKNWSLGSIKNSKITWELQTRFDWVCT